MASITELNLISNVSAGVHSRKWFDCCLKGNSNEENFYELTALARFRSASSARTARGRAALPRLPISLLDPLGIGVLPALLGAIFAEVVCSILVLIGLWTRLTVLPLIFTFIVVFFVVSGGAAFAQRELAYLYLAGWVVLFFTGAGRFSVDALRCPLKKAAA